MMMLDNSETRDAGVNVILTLLDPTKNYYTGGSGAYTRTTRSGFVKIMEQCLRILVHEDRVHTFLDMFMKPTAAVIPGLSETKSGDVDSSPWRGAAEMATFYSVLGTLARKIGYSSDTLSVEHHALVPRCLKWGKEQFLGLSDDTIKKEDTDDVASMIQAFQKAANSCSFSHKKRLFAELASSSQAVNFHAFRGCTPGSKKALQMADVIAGTFFQQNAALPDYFGYDFWLQTVSKYIKCGGLPQRLFAMEQLSELQSRSRRAMRVPPRIRVSGAGLSAVNGVYEHAGKHISIDKWCKFFVVVLLDVKFFVVVLLDAF